MRLWVRVKPAAATDDGLKAVQDAFLAATGDDKFDGLFGKELKEESCKDGNVTAGKAAEKFCAGVADAAAGKALVSAGKRRLLTFAQYEWAKLPLDGNDKAAYDVTLAELPALVKATLDGAAPMLNAGTTNCEAFVTKVVSAGFDGTEKVIKDVGTDDSAKALAANARRLAAGDAPKSVKVTVHAEILCQAQANLAAAEAAANDGGAEFDFVKALQAKGLAGTGGDSPMIKKCTGATGCDESADSAGDNAMWGADFANINADFKACTFKVGKEAVSGVAGRRLADEAKKTTTKAATTKAAAKKCKVLTGKVSFKLEVVAGKEESAALTAAASVATALGVAADAVTVTGMKVGDTVHKFKDGKIVAARRLAAAAVEVEYSVSISTADAAAAEAKQKDDTAFAAAFAKAFVFTIKLNDDYKNVESVKALTEDGFKADVKSEVTTPAAGTATTTAGSGGSGSSTSGAAQVSVALAAVLAVGASLF